MQHDVAMWPCAANERLLESPTAAASGLRNSRHERSLVSADAASATTVAEEEVSCFHGRPYLVIHADRFAEAIGRAITSDVVRSWPPRVSSVNQWADATDVLDRPALLPRLQSFYTRSAERSRLNQPARQTVCTGLKSAWPVVFVYRQRSMSSSKTCC